MIRNLLVFAILAHNLQKMAPFLDSDLDIWEAFESIPKAMDNILGPRILDSNQNVPDDINMGNFDILTNFIFILIGLKDFNLQGFQTF